MRTKKQHFVPRFYLENFTNSEGEIWIHDCEHDTLRQSRPDKTAFEKNIYTPVDEDGKRIEDIEKSLSEIESDAANILPDLLALKPLAKASKAKFSLFLATMFARSPAQLRQFAAFQGETAHWMGIFEMENRNRKKEEEGRLTDEDIRLQNVLRDKSLYSMNVDRRVGLSAFSQVPSMTKLMENMHWTFEISTDQQLLTSDNCVFWINGGPDPVVGPYGFGLGHRQAVIPFPISPQIILRLDWLPDRNWSQHWLSKARAKLANKYQAKYKERFLYFQKHDEGFRKLGMKYNSTVKNLKSGVETPEVKVVRNLPKD